MDNQSDDEVSNCPECDGQEGLEVTPLYDRAAIDAAVAAERERLLAELRTMHTQQHGRHNYYLYAAEMLAGNL